MKGLTPSPQQKEILDLGLVPIRIRAGAGTGKTTTVAMVISNLVQHHGVEPERVLGITFTNKAASELGDRVRLDLGVASDAGRQAEVHTYHGFAAQLLAEFGPLVGVDNRVRIITPTFSRQMLSEILQTSYLQHLNITYSGTVNKVRVLADRLSDHLCSPDRLLDEIIPADDVDRERIELLETLRSYQLAKSHLGVVDYGDLVLHAARIMGEHPDLALQVRDRYQTVVLDEYQDTNPAQRVLLTKIFGDGFPIIAVGDEDQTIYEWRGATPENFENFSNHFGSLSEPVHERVLTTNRRSSQSILDVANLARRTANPSAESLVAGDQTMAGHVETHWANDALAEADWIADRFTSLSETGLPWSEMAVLIRKNKDFGPIVEAFADAEIPVEVANLGGLLSVPEVAELRAWLTVLERPTDSAAATQILFGSSYRLGIADLSPIAQSLRATNSPDEDDSPSLSLLEAIEDLDEIEEIRDEARVSLAHFSATYRSLLTESQGSSLVEICRLILDHTGAWRNIEALPPARRLTARLNLYRILDLTEDWSPLSGRPSLAAFLEYLDAMEDEPAEELDAARLSGENAVTLVTVHRAKGLEWEAVAIPCLTTKNFPSNVAGGFPDPRGFGQHLPDEYRIDSALASLPEDEEARKDFFRQANLRQEWRVAYVALTRARTHLYATGAYWYGRPEPNKRPKEPSQLFEMIREHPGTVDGGTTPEGPRPEILRRSDATPAPDPLFPGGWASALRPANKDAMPEAIARRMGLADELEKMLSKHRDTLFAIEDYTEPEVEDAAKSVSVTGLVTYAQCPKRFYWTDVDPLPRRRNRAAEAGTELHRRIELYQKGHVPFEEVEHDLYDVPDEAVGQGGWASFQDSRFAESEAALVEAPFTFPLDNGYRIRGRIDAIYDDGGDWEIVDFKSGRPKTDEARLVQLQAYAVAAGQSDLTNSHPENIRVTFAYLGDGLHEESYQADAAWIGAARDRLEELTGLIDQRSFPETPGDQCNTCDFLRFCAPGQDWVDDQ